MAVWIMSKLWEKSIVFDQLHTSTTKGNSDTQIVLRILENIFS